MRTSSARERAAREILKARQQADAAAQAFADAESEVARTEDELARVGAQQAVVEAQVAKLRESVQQLAVLRYVQGGVDAGGFILGGGVGDQLQADQYAEIAAQGSAQDVEAYEATVEDLERTRALLETAKRQSQEAAENLAALRKQLEKKIVALQTDGGEAQEGRSGAPGAGGRDGRAAPSGAAAAEKAAAEAAARAASPVGGGLGGSSAPARIYMGSGMYCPLAGSFSFVDTWGAARSGGRRHQGVDLISPRGTPSVAVVSGSIRISRNRLGGNALWLNGSDGNTYYYAHFDRLRERRGPSTPATSSATSATPATPEGLLTCTSRSIPGAAAPSTPTRRLARLRVSASRADAGRRPRHRAGWSGDRRPAAALGRRVPGDLVVRGPRQGRRATSR